MSTEQVPLSGLPANTRPDKAIRNNGPVDLALERWRIVELAQGWPMYRDAREWENFQSIFHPDGAYVYTTWTGKTHINDFVAASKASMENGAFIMHRIHGSSVDILGNRAICKMKATITQRFSLDGIEVDAESDCRFCFFFERYTAADGTPSWGAKLVRHWYEKDKLIAVDPRKVPQLDDELLATFPSGYRYLGYCQEISMKGKTDSPLKVKRDMPGHRGPEHDALLRAAKAWLDGDLPDDLK
ncbi:Pathogenesis associated protein Pep2 [Pseudozyma hubeiensis]|nr:Pathogenesis associated protein Pep2 [Pseudozyma hubeiensis]